MTADEQAQFLQQLAKDLNSRDIKLPSFPDVVINIRTALEDPQCTSERLADVVRTDAVLVARLLRAANSAFHNRAGIEIVDLNLAISRLGFEVVRNTAITLAVEQIFNASEHADLRKEMKQIWESSLSLASMSFVLARHAHRINADNAFLSGLLHSVGKLYILTRARDYPALMGNPESLADLLKKWTPSIGRSIVESWGFSDEIVASIDIEDECQSSDNSPATLVDVIVTAKLLLASPEDESPTTSCTTTSSKLRISDEALPGIREAFDQHAQSMRQSAGG